MKREGFARILVVAHLLAVMAPCIAGTVEIDVLTSFPITLNGDDEAGDLAYSITSDTLLVVPYHEVMSEFPPYYREFSTDGTLLRTVELPLCDSLPECLENQPIIEIEVDPSTPTLLVAQYGPVAGGTGQDIPQPPTINEVSIIVYAVSPSQEVSFLYMDAFPVPGSGFSGIAVNPSDHTFRFLFYHRYFEVDLSGRPLKEGNCDLSAIRGMAWDSEDMLYYGLTLFSNELNLFSPNLSHLGTFQLPPVLSGVRGITHGEGDIFWLSSADHIFKVRIRYSLPPDSWISY
jgi:hypothetical protein